MKNSALVRRVKNVIELGAVSALVPETGSLHRHALWEFSQAYLRLQLQCDASRARIDRVLTHYIPAWAHHAQTMRIRWALRVRKDRETRQSVESMWWQVRRLPEVVSR